MANTEVRRLKETIIQQQQEKIDQLTALNKEKDNLLNEALGEINALRNNNYQQRLRLQMFDDLKLLLHTRAGNDNEGLAKGIDVAGSIQRHLNEWK